MDENIRNNPEIEIKDTCNYLNHIISNSVNESNIIVKKKTQIYISYTRDLW